MEPVDFEGGRPEARKGHLTLMTPHPTTRRLVLVTPKVDSHEVLPLLEMADAADPRPCDGATLLGPAPSSPAVVSDRYGCRARGMPRGYLSGRPARATASAP